LLVLFLREKKSKSEHGIEEWEKVMVGISVVHGLHLIDAVCPLLEGRLV
jgi:hypothetical protein